MSVEQLVRLRPSARGNVESGVSETVGSVTFFYDFGGAFLPSGLFSPGALERVVANWAADSLGDGTQIPLADALGLGAPSFCAARETQDVEAAGQFKVWERGDGLYSVRAIPREVLIGVNGPVALPDRVGAIWERRGEAPLGTARVECRPSDTQPQ